MSAGRRLLGRGSSFLNFLMVINVNLNYEFVKLYVKIPAFADVMATASTFYSIGSIKLVSPSLKKSELGLLCTTAKQIDNYHSSVKIK